MLKYILEVYDTVAIPGVWDRFYVKESVRSVVHAGVVGFVIHVLQGDTNCTYSVN